MNQWVKKLLICCICVCGAKAIRAQDSLNIKTLRISNWQLNYAFGIGTSFLQGSLTEYFDSQLFLLPIGMDIRYKRHHLMFDISGDLFFNRYLKKTLDDNGIIRPNGLPLDYTWLQTVYGYTIFEHPQWRVTPYLGFGGLEILESEPDAVIYPSNKNILNIKSYEWVGGVCVDYQLGKKTDILPDMKMGVQVEHGFQLRLGAMPVRCQPHLKGFGYVGSFSYYFGLRVVRR